MRYRGGVRGAKGKMVHLDEDQFRREGDGLRKKDMQPTVSSMYVKEEWPVRWKGCGIRRERWGGVRGGQWIKEVEERRKNFKGPRRMTDRCMSINAWNDSGNVVRCYFFDFTVAHPLVRAPRSDRQVCDCRGTGKKRSFHQFAILAHGNNR